MKIYHNPSCSKSREALELLKNKGKVVEIIEYVQNPLTFDELSHLIQLLGIKPIELIRTNEKIYKEVFKNKNLSDSEWIEAMVAYPKLIQRPIIIDGNKAIIGRPVERIIELINE